jgi:hypothetical protein
MSKKWPLLESVHLIAEGSAVQLKVPEVNVCPSPEPARPARAGCRYGSPS